MELARGATVLLCLLTMLAGCSAVPGLGGDGGDAYGQGDSLNASALAADHGENLREAGSFTLAVSQNATVGDGASTTAQTLRVAADTDANRTLIDAGVVRSVGNDSVTNNQTVYLTDATTFLRVQQGGQSQYRQIDANESEAPAAGTEGDRYRNLTATAPTVAATEWTRDGTVDRDGETLTRFTASGNESLDLSALGAVEGTTVTAYDATLLVTADGTVREATYTLDAESAQGQTVSQALTLRYTDVGDTTVEDPGWLDEARNASSESGGVGNATTSDATPTTA